MWRGLTPQEDWSCMRPLTTRQVRALYRAHRSKVPVMAPDLASQLTRRGLVHVLGPAVIHANSMEARDPIARVDRVVVLSDEADAACAAYAVALFASNLSTGE